MTRFIQTLSLTLLLFGIFGGCRTAGPEVASEPVSIEDELINKSIVAQGGLEALAAIETTTMSGNVMVEGMDLPISTTAKRPNKSKRVVEIPQMGMEIVAAFDGTVAWELNPMMGMSPTKLNEQRTILESYSSDMDGDLIGYQEKGSTVVYDGEEEIASGKAHKLVVTRADESVVTYYLDAESMLPVRLDGQGVDGQTGAMVNQQTTMSEYQEFQGVMMPTKMVIKSGGSTLNISIKAILVNQEVDDSEFAFPGGN